MVKRIGGFRRKTRNKLKKPANTKGKISIRNYLQQFKVGEKVLLKAEPAIQNGMYFPRFHSKTGIVKGKKGSCYEINITDGKKEKILIIHPVHLKRL
ncbi:MAG: 50S ribosomal protein L21e [Nanoarchaeota archaeon]|nr:50S ribosomal protein L21e [Nanoarchaeota archaeon]MCG2717364.1 50S ribosomal protein L21e [Nanoarchaeota archaeon]